MPFLPGQSGNPAGRRVGQKTRKAALLDSLVEPELEAIGRKTIEMAKAGDMMAAKVIYDRVWPVPRGRRLRFALPKISSPESLRKAGNCILDALGNGEITLDEANSAAGTVAAIAATVAHSPQMDMAQLLRLIDHATDAELRRLIAALEAMRERAEIQAIREKHNGSAIPVC